MTTFALVHGGFHGAWCWDLLRPALADLGFDSVAVDLPITDPAAGNVAYAEVVRAALGRVDDDIVAVGHSQGGLTLPFLGDLPTVRQLVFLHAGVPTPGRPFVEYLAEHPDFLQLPPDLPRDDAECLVMPEGVAREIFYHDCGDEVSEAAVARLRHQALTPWLEPCPIDQWPQVPCSYVVAGQDRAIDPKACWRLASSRPEFSVSEIDGGHFSFLAQPQRVADHLVSLAKDGRPSSNGGSQ
jgi:pimeloyl-ACP methyl ester carboxylesterase